MRTCIALLSAGLALIIGVGTAHAADNTHPSAGDQQLLAVVNDTRAAHQVPALTLCAPLTASAQRYAETMAANNWTEHVGPDGSRLSDRVRAAGYNGWVVAENIAWGYVTTRDVFDAWMASPGHARNIVNPSFTHVGFGFSDSTQHVSWVQNFGVGPSCPTSN